MAIQKKRGVQLPLIISNDCSLSIATFLQKDRSSLDLEDEPHVQCFPNAPGATGARHFADDPHRQLLPLLLLPSPLTASFSAGAGLGGCECEWKP